jgi:hypothetical protein
MKELTAQPRRMHDLSEQSYARLNAIDAADASQKNDAA